MLKHAEAVRFARAWPSYGAMAILAVVYFIKHIKNRVQVLGPKSIPLQSLQLYSHDLLFVFAAVRPMEHATEPHDSRT